MPPRRTQESPSKPHGKVATDDRTRHSLTGDPSQSTQAGMPSRLERIAKRAYEIYQGRGGTGARDLDDWLQAEREIDAEIQAATHTENIRER